jgi:epoxide hydrolase-like predicted phosphatase
MALLQRLFNIRTIIFIQGPHILDNPTKRQFWMVKRHFGIVGHMIKAFLFDYDGVMTSGSNGRELSARLGSRLGIATEAASALLEGVWREFTKGKLSEAQLWQHIESEYGKSIDESKRDIWSNWDQHMQPQPQMLALVKRLKDAGYAVGLLSNVIRNSAEDVRSHGGYDAFDFRVLSYETGYAKPDTEIYELALSTLPDIQPSEVIFIDDQERFLVPARELGIQTVLAKNPDQIANDIYRAIKSAVQE